MKFIVYSFFIIQFIVIFSCAKKDGNQFQKFFDKEPKHFTLENANTFLQENSNRFDSVVFKYFNQESIHTIIRRDKTKMLSTQLGNTIKYSIICFNGEKFEISFNAKDLKEEVEFWDQDFQLIRNYENSEISLSVFIYENKIDENILKELIKFMRDFNLSLITKSEENIYVKINFELLEGLIYVSKGESISGKIESTTTLEKLSEHYYYFKEVY